MIVHLGRRVSALLDGQLSPSETERAWQHVHVCHPCRDLVEIEGRIKTELAGLGRECNSAPSYLKGSLLGDISAMAPAYPEVSPLQATRSSQRVTVGLVGSSVLGFAMLGAVVFTGSLGQAPTTDRRLPVSDLSASTAPQVRPANSPPASATARGQAAVSSVVSTKVGPQRLRAGHHLVKHAVHAVK